MKPISRPLHFFLRASSGLIAMPLLAAVAVSPNFAAAETGAPGASGAGASAVAAAPPAGAAEAGGQGAAKPANKPNAEKLDNWISTYYLHPDPSKIAAAMTAYPDSDLYNPQTRIPISHFFAALLKKNPEVVSQVYRTVGTNGSEESKMFAVNTLWLVNSEESKELLKKAPADWKLPDMVKPAVEKKLTQTPTWAVDAPVRSPLSVDILWAIFFATGEEAPVQKVISVLHLAKDGQGDDLLLGGAAKMSLTSNLKDNPKVGEILSAQAKTADATTQGLIQEILQAKG